MESIERVVRRKGRTVTVRHHIGNYVSKAVVYELPSPTKAKELEKEITQYDGEYPVTIPWKWDEWRLREDGPEDVAP
jgi:hypothetical protein